MGVNKININNNDSNYAHSIFDISEYTGKTYDTLSDALADIPDGKKKGGMTVSFVSTSDNKYVQFRCTADEFTTDTTQWAIADEGVYVENPEYVYIKTDAEGKILWAIKVDGSIYYGAGCPQQVKDYIEEKISSLSLDEYEDIVAFLSDYLGSDTTLKVMIDSINERIPEIIGNPEFLEVTTDSEDKLLAGRTLDGAAFEKIGFSTPKISTEKVDIDGHTIENIQDLEGRMEIETDSEDKILSYRDSDGMKHEEVGIETDNAIINRLNLTESGMSEFQQALKDSGFNPTGLWDSSEKSFVEIPMPRECAYLNIIADMLPTSKNVNYTGFIEFYDGDGNYFKKSIKKFKCQGDSSMSFPWKNFAFDIADGSEIKFGHWVPQDSFHLKKYYIDAFRGQCIVAYRLAEQMYQTHEFGNRKPFEYLRTNDSLITSNGKFKNDYDTGALTHPDGFPIMLHFNGEKIGVYSFNLKKHRDNYAMDKKSGKQLILDGSLNNTTLWNGTVDWTAFEIRNPKDLVDIDGNPYDGDDPKELSDTDTLSKTAKDYITRLSGALPTISAISDVNTARVEFEKYFKVDYCIDYFILSNVMADFDGFNKNWIWCTWDGKLWCPTVYDKDSIFGSAANGTCIRQEMVKTKFGITDEMPTKQLWRLYQSEIIARYEELKSKKVLTTENIIRLLEDWVNTIGYNNLKEDLTEICVDANGIAQTPSYRTPHLNEGWEILTTNPIPGHSSYDPERTYEIGETCDYCNPNQSIAFGCRFIATARVTGIPPVSEFYSKFPTEGGYFNSIQRVANWLNARFNFLDSSFFNNNI